MVSSLPKKKKKETPHVVEAKKVNDWQTVRKRSRVDKKRNDATHQKTYPTSTLQQRVRFAESSSIPPIDQWNGGCVMISQRFLLSSCFFHFGAYVRGESSCAEFYDSFFCISFS